MIDFRYHLVSLISVFLALAVGIALGAGPLKEAIGDSLTGQVDLLREEKAALRTELDTRTGELGATEDALGAVAPDLLDGVLAGRRVAIVQLAEVEPAVLEQVTSRLGEAGATVTGSVQVTDAWDDPEQRTFRQTLAGTLVDYLDPVPADDAGTGTELAEALAQALTTAEPATPDVLSENAVLLLELLTEGGLVGVEGEITAPADAVVVLAGPTVSLEAVEAATEATASADPDDDADADLQEARTGSARQIAAAVQSRSTGAVVAGGELEGSALLVALRDDEALVTRISTVESVHTLRGQIAVPLALSARIGGTVGHYGTGGSATAVMPPRVVLPVLVRVLPVDGGDDGTGTDGTVVDPGATPTEPAVEPTEPAPTEGADAAGDG